MTVESVLPNLESLKTSYVKSDVDTASTMLNKLKVQLTSFTALPPTFANTPTAQKELLIAREVLEYAVLLSVKVKDQIMFERHYQQLRTFYTDTRHLLPVSQQEYPILGLNLLRLLVQNRTAEFHTELELLSPEVQQNVYIKHAVELEQFLMEGAYNKVIGARKDIPAESYAYFMDLLMLTVRDEIAHCCEKAYPTLSMAAARELMSFDTPYAANEYAVARGWVVVNDTLQFQQEKQEPSAKDIPSFHLINQTLGYAKELERIV